MNQRVERGLLALAVAGVLGVTGCSHSGAAETPIGGGAPSTSPSAGATPGAASVYGPLWDVFNGGTDFVTAETAKTKAADKYLVDCMAKSGFRYVTPPVDVAEIRVTGLELAYRTRIADAAFREKSGYGVTSHLVVKGLEDEAPVDTGRESLGASERAAFDKAETECGKKMAYEFLPGDLTDQLWQQSSSVSARILSDPEVVAAESQWRSCMAESGFAFTEMEEPPNALEKESRDVQFGSSTAKRLHQKELNLAKIDWACREKFVNAPYLRVRDREETALLEQNFETVNKLRERMRAIIFG